VEKGLLKKENSKRGLDENKWEHLFVYDFFQFCFFVFRIF